MQATYIGALDQGTTSTRFILFDRQARPVAWHQLEHAQHYPQPGWVEHDASEIWRNTCTVIAHTLQEAGATPADVAAMGITNQRETVLVWDAETGQPLHRALVWQDTRTGSFCSTLPAQRCREVTGLPPATYFSGSKLRWLLQEVPAVRQAARRGTAMAGTIDSWLLYKLTGRHVTDVTNASRTQLMDLRTLRWSDEMLRLMDIPREVLPAIGASSSASFYGTTLPGGPLGEGVPVCGCLGDQQAALFGQACHEAGQAKCTYGTGGFLLLHTGARPTLSSHGLLSTVAFLREGEPASYALEGSVAMAGSLVQWLRDQLGIIASSGEVEALAASVPDNGGVYFVPAFSGLFAPHWDSTARGVIVGLTHHAGRGHIARSALEATAFQVRDVFAAMQADAGLRLPALRVDGGMTANSLLMQFQADVLGTAVVRPQCTETTALGAAFAAGLAVGFWGSLAELRALWQASATWKPTMTDEKREQLLHHWDMALERSKQWQPR